MMTVINILVVILATGLFVYPQKTIAGHCAVFAQNFNLTVTAGSSAQFIFTVNGNFAGVDFLFIKPANGDLTISGSGNPTMWNATEASGAFTIQAASNAASQVLTFYTRQDGHNCDNAFTLTVTVSAVLGGQNVTITAPVIQDLTKTTPTAHTVTFILVPPKEEYLVVDFLEKDFLQTKQTFTEYANIMVNFQSVALRYFSTFNLALTHEMCKDPCAEYRATGIMSNANQVNACAAALGE